MQILALILKLAIKISCFHNIDILSAQKSARSFERTAQNIDKKSGQKEQTALFSTFIDILSSPLFLSIF